MKTVLLIVVFIFSSSLLHAQSINAPVYDNEGFFLNGTAVGAAWSIDDSNVDAEAGAGLGLKLGYNFNTTFGLFASFDAASMEPEDGEDYILGHLDIGGQATFRSTADRFRPFVRTSILGLSVQDDVVELNGSGFGLGAGGLLFLSEKLALDVNYTHAWINLSELKVDSQSFDDDRNATTGRFFIGLAYHF